MLLHMLNSYRSDNSPNLGGLILSPYFLSCEEQSRFICQDELVFPQMMLHWPTFRPVFLIQLFLFAGVY